MDESTKDVIELTERPNPLVFNQYSLVISDNQSLEEEFRKILRRLDALASRVERLETRINAKRG